MRIINNKAIRTSIFYFCLLLLITTIGLISCGKKESTVPEKEEVTEKEMPTNESLFYKLNRVENIPATQENSSSTGASPVYYSLENKTILGTTHQKTRNWDLAFEGLFNSFLSGNSGSNNTNLGKGNTAVGGILIKTEAFNDVINIPADSEFKTEGNLIGTDDYGDFGEGTGWYLYDFSGNIVRNGTEENQHIAYTLYNELTLKNGTIVSPRTIIVKTAKGHYAKIKMISCYKDLYTPELWKKSSPKMYFTFEYLMVPKGSTKFEIK